MLRSLFFILTLLHGFMHLLGCLSAFDLTKKSLLFSSIPKNAGWLWLAATILWFVTAFGFLLKRDFWWLSGAFSIVLSQALIIFFWQDAKFGTIASMILLGGIVWGYSNWSFSRMVNSEIETLISPGSSRFLHRVEKTNTHLPPIVKQWVAKSADFKPRDAQSIHLVQTGSLRTTPLSNWLSFDAEQWVSLKKPGFVWKAEVGTGTLTPFSGRDKFVDGKGSMLIKLFTLINVVNAENDDIDQGAALRFLAETVWIPTAIPALPITWETITPQTVKATLYYKSCRVSGIFTFNNEGQITKFEAPRYNHDTKKNETWIVEIDPQSYTGFNGLYIPVRASVTWKLSEGDFTWYKLNIEKTEITQNNI